MQYATVYFRSTAGGTPTNEILAIVDFLGNEMSDEQAARLMDECRQPSIADRERVLATVEGGPLYGQLSEHDREMGGLSRY